MPDGTRCVQGRDAHGATYSLAYPLNWNRDLVVFAHGGPTLLLGSGPKRALGYASNGAVDLLTLGYALATTTYRDGYFDSPAYVEDLVAARGEFIHKFGTPRRTVLYGVSYGAHVAVMGGQRRADKWDGVVAEDGDDAGELVRFYQLLDLRVVYQYYCRNLPLPTERQYPLWQGVHPDTDVTTQAGFDAEVALLESRVSACTGVDVPADRRTAAQRHALANILAVTQAVESDLKRAVSGASMALYTFARFEAGGRNAFDNSAARYTGSDDDTALNAGVSRYTADRPAFALARELAATGTMQLPLLTLHPIHDRVRVESEWVVRQVYERAGNTARLDQFFDDGTGHLPGPSDRPHHIRASVAAILAMFSWIETGARPTFADLAARCASLRAASAEDVCTSLLRDYVPPSIWTIIPPQGRVDATRRSHELQGDRPVPPR